MRRLVNLPVCLLICSIALKGDVAHAQHTARAVSQCYEMRYTRDSTDTPLPDRFDDGSPLPDHFRWLPVDSQARFWSDTPTRNSREAIKQTRGRASWRRVGTDSVVIVLWSEFVTSADIRFISFNRPVSGVVEWLDEAHRPIERRKFVSRVVTCPHLDPPANER